MKPNHRARLQRMEAARVETWNAKVRVGDPVIYRNEFGAECKSHTRSAAELLGGHTAVVWIVDKAGCVALDRVRAALSQDRDGPSNPDFPFTRYP